VSNRACPLHDFQGLAGLDWLAGMHPMAAVSISFSLSPIPTYEKQEEYELGTLAVYVSVFVSKLTHACLRTTQPSSWALNDRSSREFSDDHRFQIDMADPFHRIKILASRATCVAKVEYVLNFSTYYHSYLF